jgi:hypothetical protein
VFYLKMKGDYYRYLAEVAVADAKAGGWREECSRAARRSANHNLQTHAFHCILV